MENKAFIEVQFPVSKISKESYKERKANLGQTLTGLGKWWGRKPLILVRSGLLGLLMPASDNAKKDMDVFLKILTMDDKGLELRKYKSIPKNELLQYLSEYEKQKYFVNNNGKWELKSISRDERDKLQNLVFRRFSYDEKIRYCKRPEEIKLKKNEEWEIINEHLGTNSFNLQDLIKQLSHKKFNRECWVGDCFSGGGSIPFEAARMGCNSYGSELNPIASLLTWASLNINGLSDNEIEEIRKFQLRLFEETNLIIDKMGIEKNEKGDRALSYIYCIETKCPDCGYRIPISPSWIIGKGSKTVAILRENEERKKFDIDIVMNASRDQINLAQDKITLVQNQVHCPHCNKKNPISTIRRDTNDNNMINVGKNIRLWDESDIEAREDDLFIERLYCIRYINSNGVRYYQNVDKNKLDIENEISKLLKEKYNGWKENEYITSSKIIPGYKTNELMRTRGWTYWNHLFTPRQQLLIGLILKNINQIAKTKKQYAIGILSINKVLNWSSKLSMWNNASVAEKPDSTFINQALNPLFNFGCRSFLMLKNPIIFNINNYKISSKFEVDLIDARNLDKTCDIWITDPPYADAVNYHELSEFFLSWDRNIINKIFPNWYTDSKRVLAVQGRDEEFNKSMIEIYKNLNKHMPENGMQIVMFTHQDPSVWAALTLILWSAGLRVTAAWNISTETESGGLKTGNYVKGTVLLVLRKQKSNKTAFLDELYPQIEFEVKRQIDTMNQIDDDEDPNFSDPDFLLAAYAASLKILTSYKNIEDLNVEHELSKNYDKTTSSPITDIINQAVKIAYDYLIPAGFDKFVWKNLTSEERFYLKGIELEKNNIHELSAYQELARGFGVKEYKNLLQNTKANKTRLKNSIEFGSKYLNTSEKFSQSVLRNILMAQNLSVKKEKAIAGFNWLKNEVPNYWNVRNEIINLLEFFITIKPVEHMNHWDDIVDYSKFLLELVKNDGV